MILERIREMNKNRLKRIRETVASLFNWLQFKVEDGGSDSQLLSTPALKLYIIVFGNVSEVKRRSMPVVSEYSMTME